MFGRVLHAGRGFGGRYLPVIAGPATLCARQADLGDRVSFPGEFIESNASRISPMDTVIWDRSSKGAFRALHVSALG